MMMAAWAAGAGEPTAGQKALMDAYNAGVKLLAEGKKTEARTAFEQVVKDAAASEEDQAKTVLAGAANNLGMLLLEQGQIKDALAAYERSVKADPTLGSAANNLARLLIQSGNHTDAAALLARNLKVSRAGRHEALLLTATIFELTRAPAAKQDAVWGELFKETDQSTAAREALVLDLARHDAHTLALRKTEEGIAADPAWAAGKALKARLTARAGQTLDALKQFRALVKNNPADASLRTDLLVLLLEKELLDEARAQSEDAVKAFPEDSMVWFQRGKTLELLGDAKEAEKSYYKSTKFNENNDKAWNNLARMAEMRGDEKTAVVCYSNALRLAPNNARTLFNLGRLYVVKNIDFKVGVKLLSAAAAGKGEGVAEARKLLDSIAAASSKTDDAQTKPN
jgi:tetratricopeptide (TPR) repeat protein